MRKKPTLLIEDSVCERLPRVAGRGGISKFTEKRACAHVAQMDLGAQYREAAREAARELEAHAWTEGLIGSVTK